MGEVGDEHADEKVPQAGDLFRVPEEGLRRLPERGVQVELLDLLPGGRRYVQVELLPRFRLGVGVEERAEDGEPLGLVRLHDDGDHLAVEVGLGVVGGDESLELLEPVLVVAELAPVEEVLTKVLTGQTQFVEQERCPVGSEAAGVEADVQEPIVLEVGLFGGGVEQEPGIGLVPLDADLGFEGTHLIEPHDLDVLQLEEPEVVQELPVGVVPEDDPVSLLIERCGESASVDLPIVHRWLTVLTSEIVWFTRPKRYCNGLQAAV